MEEGNKIKPKILLMARKHDCLFCSKMKPVFEEVIKEYSSLANLSFGLYDVEADNWELADNLGIDGVPAFMVMSNDEGTGEMSTCYEVNNDGLISKEVLVSMIVNNINK